MGELIELIKCLLHEIPNTQKVLVIILLIIMAIVYLFKSSIIKYIINYLKTLKIRIYRKTKKDNRNHGIFTYIDEILKVKLNNINFNNTHKNKLFKDFMKIQIESLKKHMLILAKYKNINDMSMNEFNAFVMNGVYDYINETDNEMKYEFGCEIMNIIEQSSWNVDFNSFIINHIKEVINNRSRDDDNDFVLGTILAIMSVSLKSIFQIASNRYRNMNGILDEILNKKYKK